MSGAPRGRTIRCVHLFARQCVTDDHLWPDERDDDGDFLCLRCGITREQADREAVEDAKEQR